MRRKISRTVVKFCSFQRGMDTGELFYGWIIVGLAFLLLFAHQIHHVFGVFLDPLVNEFGWSKLSASVVYSIAYGMLPAMGIIWGKLFDIHGPRKIIGASCFLGGLGLSLTSSISNLFQFYLTFGIIWGLGWNSFFICSNAWVRKWFIKRAGLALGIAVCGVPIGWAVSMPLTEHLIDFIGWRHTFLFLGTFVWVIGIIVAIFARRSPESIGSFPDGKVPSESNHTSDSEIEEWSSAEVVRTRSFWMVWLVLLCLLVVLFMIITHGISYATEQGMARRAVVFVFGMMGAISISGRIGFGWLGDRLITEGLHPVHARRYMFSLAGLLMGIGVILLLQTTSLVLLWIWAIIFGIGYGTHVPQIASTIGDMFGEKNIGFIMGLLGTSAGAAGIIGPIFGGWIYDITGSYTIALQAAVLLCFLAIIFSLFIVAPEKLD